VGAHMRAQLAAAGAPGASGCTHSGGAVLSPAVWPPACQRPACDPAPAGP
jgi:hypothetical protein